MSRPYWDSDEEDFVAAGPDGKPIEFHWEVEPIDMWDDILDDGRIKYRTVAKAYEEYMRLREEKESNDE